MSTIEERRYQKSCQKETRQQKNNQEQDTSQVTGLEKDSSFARQSAAIQTKLQSIATLLKDPGC